MSARPDLYGLMAQFETAEELLEASRKAREAGYRRMDAYSPFPIEGLAEEVGMHGNRVPVLVLIGGLCGAALAYYMQFFSAVVDYPINVGGRPYYSWPSFIPVTFEMTVLFASLSAVIGMLAMNRLPRPYHPVFNAPSFERVTLDRFFLCIEADDPRFDPGETRRFLEGLHPQEVCEVEA